MKKGLKGYTIMMNLIDQLLENKDIETVMDPNDGCEELFKIIYHSGCIKINAALAASKKFKPEFVTIDKDGFNHSLVFIYVNSDQGVFEVGEVNNPINHYFSATSSSPTNHPYKMALDMLFDRVVLKNSGLDQLGYYSENDAYALLELINQESKQIQQQKDQNDNPDNYQEKWDYEKEFDYICNQFGFNKKRTEAEFNLDQNSNNKDYFNACMKMKSDIY